ncbi:heparan-alpha-glucosaminide N-acetyltransferase domain-containing protein [bacterium]|nr:heparan-alpha-glucosaminide N-acetyltransferase domain-containing protein [bacterium]
MSEEVSPYSTPLPEGRLMSLDAFRGFAMFWIVGGEALAHALANLNGLQSEALDTVVTQLKHVEWEGFRFYDLIFPSFVFIVGTSLVFSLRKLLAPGDRRDAVRRLIWRGLLLWLVGIIYYGGISKGWYDAGTNQGVRLLGVLQRIGICYLVTGLLFIYMPVRGLVAAFVILLGGYWALLSFVAVPGQGAVSFEEGRNITNWFDSKYLPFFKWKVTHDPEGILSTFPAIATCLLGVFAGLLLKNERMARANKGLILGVAGAAMIFAGNFWGEYHPVIKNLWTSSFVVLAGGWSLVLLSFFYLVMDVVKVKMWAMPLVWIGMNPIAIYLLSSVVDFNQIAGRILGGPVADWADGMVPGLGALLVALGGMGLVLWLCRALYKREVFFRI